MTRLAACLLLAAAALTAAARDAVLVDRIVALVGKDVITLTELAERTAQAERELVRRRIAAPDLAVLERQVLERMVLDKAQLQRAAESGLRVEAVVSQEIQREQGAEFCSCGNLRLHHQQVDVGAGF